MRVCDYELIAAIIRKLPNSLGLREVVAKHFASELAKSNPRFNTTLFFKACEITAQGGDDE